MNQTFPEFLASVRLRLRRFEEKDAEALSVYRTLPEVARYQSWTTFSVEEAGCLIRAAQEHNIPGRWFQMAIVEAGSGRLIGDCGLHCDKEDPRQMELGITLAPEAQGNGFALETVQRVLRHVFEDLQKHRVYAVTDARNEPAMRLFERSGFRREAHFRENMWFKGEWSSEMIFAMRKSEWEKQYD